MTVDRSARPCVSRGMRPNLSLEHLALTLAVLGTACAKSSAPDAVHADQPSASAAATTAAPSAEPTPPTATATAAASALEAAPKGSAPRIGHGRAPGGSAGTTGQASCGAGTCSADMKKK